MYIEEVSKNIEKTSYEITEINNQDECIDCRIVNRNHREDMIEALGSLINLELLKLEQLLDEIMEDVFRSKKENHDFYKKLGSSEEHLNAIRRTVEIKRYLEARNDGINRVRFKDCD